MAISFRPMALRPTLLDSMPLSTSILIYNKYYTPKASVLKNSSFLWSNKIVTVYILFPTFHFFTPKIS
jgi:hypothetical protein